MKTLQHRVELRQLTEAEGGGWLATIPDLPGCMSDGETPEEAIQNAREAEVSWIEANEIWMLEENVRAIHSCEHRKSCCRI